MELIEKNIMIWKKQKMLKAAAWEEDKKTHLLETFIRL